MKKVFALLFLLSISFFSFAQNEVLRNPGLYAQLETEKGTIVFRLYQEEAPLAVTSFVGLAEGTIAPLENGSPYYSGLTFFHKIANYALFSGNPENTKEQKLDISFPQQHNEKISLGEPGILAFAGVPGITKAGNFFITLRGDDYLDNVYTPFGKMVEGIEILDRMDVGTKILSINILRVGNEAESFVASMETLSTLEVEASQNQIESLRKENPQLAEALSGLPEFTQTESGMYYYTVYEGFGDKPKFGKKVSVHYTGSLLNGTIFDSSVQRGQAFSMTLGKDSVIMGWLETLMDMQPGENRVVFIPPNLGYGNQGAGGIIPPNSWLKFEIQLLGIE